MGRHRQIVSLIVIGFLCSALGACSIVHDATQQVKDTGQAVGQRGKNLLHAISGATMKAIDTGKQVVGETEKRVEDVVDGVGKIKEGMQKIQGHQ